MSRSRITPSSAQGLLSAATWLRIAGDPLAARLVQQVWSRLAELERAGHDPGALAALRYELARHQPTRRGTCRACARRAWPVMGRTAPLALRHMDPGPHRIARQCGGDSLDVVGGDMSEVPGGSSRCTR